MKKTSQGGHLMKVLLVNGSPRKEGNTYLALREVADTLEAQGVETEIFWLGKAPINGCTMCGGCRETKRCAVNDIVTDFQALAQTADGFVFGSPVHFAGPAGNFCSFMDRLFYSCVSDGKTLYMKPAAAITVARRAGTSASLDRINKYITYGHMPLVSSSYWNMAFGAKRGEVVQDEEGMQIMRNIGLNMAWLLRCIQAGADAGVERPQREAGARTNFIR